MNRTRTKSRIAKYGNRCLSLTDYSVVCESITDQNPGPGNCIHERYMPYQTVFTCQSGWGGWEEPTYASCASLILNNPSLFNSLNWDKLPSSTKAGILQILAEIDDTIAIFTRRFWKELSYGSFTWGVMPFVSDLKALVIAVRNLSVDLKSFSYEDEYPIEAVIPYENGRCVSATLKYTGSVKYTGKASIPSGLDTGLLSGLDRIGLHPDLATAWDLVPLSFIVDYFIPVGDFLETFRQGGWIKAINFSGYCTIKCSTELTLQSTGNCTQQLQSAKGGKGSVYARFRSDTVLFHQPERNQTEFDLPSPRQLFNTLYVLLAKR